MSTLANKSSVAIRHVSRVCAVKSAIWAKLLSYTVEDIYNLRKGVRAELIDGEMYMVAALRNRASGDWYKFRIETE